MAMKLFESELKVMELLWQRGEATARDIAEALGKQTGWSKTTSYTVLKKCVDRGAVERRDPGFVCRPLVTREQVQAYETDELIDRMYGGSADLLVASLLGRRRLSPQEIARLRELIDRMECEA